MSAVRSLVEGSVLEVRERTEAALAPMWDAVKLLQAGVRDGAGALAGLQQDLAGLQSAQVRLLARWLHVHVMVVAAAGMHVRRDCNTLAPTSAVQRM